MQGFFRRCSSVNSFMKSVVSLLLGAAFIIAATASSLLPRISYAQQTTPGIATISGVVTYGGVPTNGAVVVISGTTRRFSVKQNGSFQIKLSTPGQYFISVLPKGNVLAQPITQSVNVIAGANSPISLDLKKISGTNSVIFGRVVSQGLPVAQAKVKFYDTKEVVTDQNGIYSSGEIPAGRYYMAINFPGSTFTKPFRQVLLKTGSGRREDFSAASFPNNFAVLKSGLYDFKVITASGNCNLANLNLQGVASLSQVKDRLTIQLPTLGVFSTKMVSSAFSVNIRKGTSLCRVSGPVTGLFDSSSNALVQADFSVQCIGQPACAIKVNGEMTPKN